MIHVWINRVEELNLTLKGWLSVRCGTCGPSAVGCTDVDWVIQTSLNPCPSWEFGPAQLTLKEDHNVVFEFWGKCDDSPTRPDEITLRCQGKVILEHLEATSSLAERRLPMQPHGGILVVKVGHQRAAMSADGSEPGDWMSMTGCDDKVWSPVHRRQNATAPLPAPEDTQLGLVFHGPEFEPGQLRPRAGAGKPGILGDDHEDAGDPWMGKDPWRHLQTQLQRPPTSTTSSTEKPAADHLELRWQGRAEQQGPAPVPYEGKTTEVEVAMPRSVSTTAVVTGAQVAPTQEPTTVEKAEVAGQSQLDRHLAKLTEALGLEGMQIVYQRLEEAARKSPASASSSYKAPMLDSYKASSSYKASCLYKTPTRTKLPAEPQEPTALASTTQMSMTSPATAPTTQLPGIAAPTAQTPKTQEPTALDSKVIATLYPPPGLEATKKDPKVASPDTAGTTEAKTPSTTSPAATVAGAVEDNLQPLPTLQRPVPFEGNAADVAAEQAAVSVVPPQEPTTVEEAEVAEVAGQSQLVSDLEMLTEALGLQAMQLVYQRLEEVATMSTAFASSSNEAPKLSSPPAEPQETTANAATSATVPLAPTTQMSMMSAAAPTTQPDTQPESIWREHGPIGRELSTPEFWEVSASTLVFHDIVPVFAKCLVYHWDLQLDTMTKADRNVAPIHGLGPPGSGRPSRNLSWLVMGYDRRMKSWSSVQRFRATEISSCQKEKADRLLGPVRKIAERVRARETSQTSTWQGELRLDVCTMVETFLRMCSAGVLLHGPMIGYVQLSTIILR